MKCIVKNKTDQDLTSLIDVIQDFFPHVQKKMGFKKPVKVNLVSDMENSKDIFGKTAFYEPSKHSITLFIDNRHPKDVLRSLSHELVHHAQNCRGDFDKMASTEPGYAQKDPHLRKMEAEAYLLGNGFLFRDYEDYIKQQRLTENKKMIRIDRTILENLVRQTLNEVLNEKVTDPSGEPGGTLPTDGDIEALDENDPESERHAKRLKSMGSLEEDEFYEGYDLDEDDRAAKRLKSLGGLEEDMDEEKVQHIDMEPMHIKGRQPKAQHIDMEPMHIKGRKKPKLMRGYAKIVKDKNHPKHKEAKKQLAARRAWNKTAAGKEHLAKGGGRSKRRAVAGKKSGDKLVKDVGNMLGSALKHLPKDDLTAKIKASGEEPKSAKGTKPVQKESINENVDHRSNKEWYGDELFHKLTEKWTK